MAGGHFGREKDVSVMSDYDAYIGLDVHKDSISVAVAEAGRELPCERRGHRLRDLPSYRS
jgi:hypothetical protein